MVFFVCEGCNETVKKNKVEIHAGRCRNCWAVSCVDCSVVFEGSDYAAHTSCISEAEKYEKTLYQGDKNKRRSGKKQQQQKTLQEQWMDVVHSATCFEDGKVQAVLTRIGSYDHVPRKKHKFINFVSNSLALRDTTLAEKAWDIYEGAFKAAVLASGDQHGSLSGAEGTIKRPAATAHDAVVSKKPKTEERPIQWRKLIKRALKRAGCEVKLDTLWEQMLQQLQAKMLSTTNEEELKREFEAAIRESDRFAVVEVVRLNRAH